MSFLRRGAPPPPSSGAWSEKQAWAQVSSALATHEQRLSLLQVIGPADPSGVTRPPWPTPGLLFATDRSLLLGLRAGSYLWLAFCISLEDVHTLHVEDHDYAATLLATLTVDGDTQPWTFDLPTGSATSSGRAEVLEFIETVTLARAAHAGQLTPSWQLG